jgi:hypothetical protein
VGTPGGLDAREYEGSRLNGRERQRQELVFKEREWLDTLGRGQFVDQSRQELLGAHGSPLRACSSEASRPSTPGTAVPSSNAEQTSVVGASAPWR